MLILIIIGSDITHKYFVQNKSCLNIKHFIFDDLLSKHKFVTDWSYFKNLETLKIRVHDIDIKLIKKFCTKLKFANITTNFDYSSDIQHNYFLEKSARIY
jgi:hypothetical protein